MRIILYQCVVSSVDIYWDGGLLGCVCLTSAPLCSPPGLEFPWGPKPFAEVVAGPLLRSSGANCGHQLPGRVCNVGVYFSAHWVSVITPPSKHSPLEFNHVPNKILYQTNIKCACEFVLCTCVCVFISWQCPPCRSLTRVLAESYRTVKDSGQKFEIVFVSADRWGF